MASGKESPRQKMINLMYLVFIAMLALNMSKEVLSAFGVIDEDINSSTETYRVTSMQEWKGLKALAEDPENSLKYEEPFKIIDSIYQMGGRLDAFINKIKPSSVLKIDKYDQNNNGDFTDLIPDYEAMDKTETIDVLFFTNKKDAEIAELKNLTDTAVLYLNHIKDFRDNSIAALTSAEIEMQKSFEETYPDKKWTPLYTDLIKEIGDKFNTDDHKVGKNKVLGYVKYHYEGYPLISSVTKMSVIQDNVQKIIAKTFSKTLGSDGVVGGTNTLKAVVLPGYYDKDNKWVSTSSTVYEGENFKGKIVLAKYDSTLAPSDIKIPNFYEGSGIQAIQDNKLVGGQLILDGKPSSGTGRKSILGSLNFDLQKGSRVDETVIPVTFEYEVTKKPTTANIANVRMDVVYQSVSNYLSISIPNVSSENIIVSANGNPLKGSIKSFDGVNKWIYTLSNPQSTKGKRKIVDINVTTRAYDGSPALGPFTVPFRIKDLPDPITTFDGSAGFKSYSKNVLKANKVEHKWPDDFELGKFELETQEFMVQVGNNRPRRNTGPKFNGDALKDINKAKSGALIIIYNVKSKGKMITTFTRTTTKSKLVIKVK